MKKFLIVIIALLLSAQIAVAAGGTLTPGGGGLLTPMLTALSNVWNQMQQFVGGIEDALGIHIAPPYTYIVCQQAGECDYTDIQSALNQASSTQAATKIFVKNGTYTAPSGGYVICSSNVKLTGESYPQSGTTGVTVNFSGTTAPAAFASCNNTSQLTGIEISDLKINNTGNASSSKGIDFTGISLSYFHDLRITAANQSLYATGTIADYNTIMNIVSAPAGTSGNNTLVLGGRANANLIENVRSINTASTTAYDIFARSNTLILPDSETGALLSYHIESGSFGTTIIQPYSESNTAGFKFESGSADTNVIGGYGNDTTNIQNLGGTFCFQDTHMAAKSFTHCEEQPNMPPTTWLPPYMNGSPSANQAASTSRIIGLEINNPTDGFTKGLNWVMGTTTSTASYTVALYGPLQTADTFASAPLLVSKEANVSGLNASVAVNPQWSSLTFMPAGNYFAVIETASTSVSYSRQANGVVATGLCGFNDAWNSSAYSSTLPASGPAFTSTGSSCPVIQVQMAAAASTY